MVMAEQGHWRERPEGAWGPVDATSTGDTASLELSMSEKNLCTSLCLGLPFPRVSDDFCLLV